MVRGNKELRFRASDELHEVLEKLKGELGAAEKSAAAKLLIKLGDDKILEVVNYFDSITHPLNNNQFEDFMLSVKIRVKQLRETRKKAKNRNI